MIECVPPATLLVVSVAIADAFRLPVPSDVVPSMNVTEPVGMPGAVEVTVAVNVTGIPKTDGFAEDVTVVAVASILTTCVIVFEVLTPKLASPP